MRLRLWLAFGGRYSRRQIVVVGEGLIQPAGTARRFEQQDPTYSLAA
jgi:hypothetical protein